VKWRAPANGAGTVVFYASGIATNGGQGMRGDGAANAVAKFYQDTTARLGGGLSGNGNNTGLNGGVTAIDDLNNVKSLQIFPNPATDFVKIQWTSTTAKTYQIAVRSITGATVLMENWTAQNGDNQQVIDVQNWSTGVYTLQMTNGNERVMRKIVKR
jgi:hypothetical protein